jgi:hypothetical protein
LEKYKASLTEPTDGHNLIHCIICDSGLQIPIANKQASVTITSEMLSFGDFPPAESSPSFNDCSNVVLPPDYG